MSRSYIKIHKASQKMCRVAWISFFFKTWYSFPSKDAAQELDSINLVETFTFHTNELGYIKVIIFSLLLQVIGRDP